MARSGEIKGGEFPLEPGSRTCRKIGAALTAGRTGISFAACLREASDLGRPSDQCLERTLEMAERMLRLADQGDAVRDDPGCGVLYGVLRDSAYKLKQMAEAERQTHLKQSLERLISRSRGSLR
jgi:hypothetical protein